VTKAEVIAAIAEKTGLDKEHVSLSVEAFFKVVQKSMEQGENIYIRGFGSFINKKRARKIARNIAKNTAIVLEEHYVPSFKPSKSFVNRIKKSEVLQKRLKEIREQKELIKNKKAENNSLDNNMESTTQEIEKKVENTEQTEDKTISNTEENNNA